MEFPSVQGESGYIYVDDKRYPIQLYDNPEILNALGVSSMAILSPNQVAIWKRKALLFTCLHIRQILLSHHSFNLFGALLFAWNALAHCIHS